MPVARRGSKIGAGGPVPRRAHLLSFYLSLVLIGFSILPTISSHLRAVLLIVRLTLSTIPLSMMPLRVGRSRYRPHNDRAPQRDVGAPADAVGQYMMLIGEVSVASYLSRTYGPTQLARPCWRSRAPPRVFYSAERTHAHMVRQLPVAPTASIAWPVYLHLGLLLFLTVTFSEDFTLHPPRLSPNIFLVLRRRVRRFLFV
ncbi:hypothetical protein DFH06DRAFT_623800 [Mycena polygramma]|nr:hypothetical protein DFH06DRAFT_623800 [Mycena polygramma]